MRKTTLLSSDGRSALQDKFIKTEEDQLTLLHYDINRLMQSLDDSFEGIGSMYDYELAALSDPINRRYLDYELKKLNQIRQRGLTDDISQFDVTKYVETEFGYAKEAAFQSGSGPKAKDRDEMYNQFAALQFIECIFVDCRLVPSDNIPGKEHLGNWFEIDPSEFGTKISAFYRGKVGEQLENYQIISKVKRVTYSTKEDWKRQDITKNINSRIRPINRKLISQKVAQVPKRKKQSRYCFESVIEIEVDKSYDIFEKGLKKDITRLELAGSNVQAINGVKGQIAFMKTHDEERMKYRWNVLDGVNQQESDEEEEDVDMLSQFND